MMEFKTNRSMSLCLLWIILLVIFNNWIEGAPHKDVEQQLIDSLLSNFSKFSRPVDNYSDVVTIHFHTKLIHILEVNEKDQTLSSKHWVSMTWNNEYLTWNVSQWNGIDQVQIKQDELWIPDIFLYNSAPSTYSIESQKDETTVNIKPSGDNIWYFPAIYTSTCNVEIDDFPFDNQICKLRFGSWASDGSKINMEKTNNIPIITEEYVNNTEWEVRSVSLDRKETSFTGFTHAYVDITLTIHIRRKPMFHLINKVIPSSILMGLLLLSFYLPPQSGERIGFSITIFLSIMLFSQLVSESLPKNSERFARLSILYLLLTLVSALNLIFSCLVIRMFHKGSDPNSKPAPKWLLRFLGMPQKQETFVKSAFICVNKDDKKLDNFDIDNVGIIGPQATQINECKDEKYTNEAYKCNVKLDENEIKEQWLDVAKATDTRLFWLSLIVSVTSMFGLLMPSVINSLE